MPTRVRDYIAVVEDDSGLRADLVEFLELRGFGARGFESAESFFQVWSEAHFDLLLLDVVLPGASGLNIAQRVRLRDDVGIVILTGQDSDECHVLGLNSGADLFLSKRSSLDVIEAACLSVLRRRNRAGDGNLHAGGSVWRIDTRRWLLDGPDGISVGLTQNEVAILAALFERPGQPVARAVLLERLGRQDTLSGLRNLDNAVSRLRRKVQDACGAELPLKSIYGKGYAFAEACETTA